MNIAITTSPSGAISYVEITGTTINDDYNSQTIPLHHIVNMKKTKDNLKLDVYITNGDELEIDYSDPITVTLNGVNQPDATTLRNNIRTLLDDYYASLDGGIL